MSPPLLTMSRRNGAAARMTVAISSATLPATAAMGVMKYAVQYGQQASAMRCATGPRRLGMFAAIGERSAGSSSTEPRAGHSETSAAPLR